jgi:L-ascorbate metabolism protein UlaG (beta-lactamase superfamily)
MKYSQEVFADMEATVWYLYHSGFAVRTQAHMLVFDYWRNGASGSALEDGVVSPGSLADSDVIVFASHRHGDHFDREILSWRESIPRLRLILSDDIKTPLHDSITRMAPGMRITMPDLAVETLASNDEGVAFLVEVDGMRIYHAGDLNWWHWEGEPDDYNAGMAESYKREVGKLRGKPIDIAFVPVDPRLGEQYAWGVDYLMRKADVGRVIPMHFGGDVSVVSRLLGDPVSAPYRDKIIPLTVRGQAAEITLQPRE